MDLTTARPALPTAAAAGAAAPVAAEAGPAELTSALQPLRQVMRRAAGFGAAASLLALTPSWYMMEVYDRVVNSRSGMTLAMLTVAALLAYAITVVQEWARSALLHAAADEFDTQLGPRIFDAALVASRKRQSLGGVQALQDLRTLREFFASPAFLALFEAPMVIVCFVLLNALSPWLGAAALVAALLQGLFGWLNARGTGPLMRRANQHGMAAQRFAENVLAQSALVHALGMFPAVHGRWLAQQREALALQAHASAAAGAWQATSRLLQNLVTSGLLGLSCWLLLNDGLNGGGGMLVVAGILGGRALSPFVQVIGQWGSVQQAREAWQRLGQLLKTEPVPAAAMSLPAPQGALKVEGVSVNAPGSSTTLLRDLNLVLPRGEVLAVLGPSGSGKSTLARVLLGLWTPNTGRVRLDGADVASWAKDELGRHLGHLPQDVELFDGSLADNIARFGAVDAIQLDAVLDATGLRGLVASLPDGVATRIGPNGARLSGGQRQRVGLARALYGEPALVVLDEPDAHLDDEGDLALARLIDAYRRRGTTFVVITHRQGVLQVADKVLVLHEGRPMAFGPRNDVMLAIRQANEQAQARQRMAQAGRVA